MSEPTWEAICHHPLDDETLEQFRAYCANPVILNVNGQGHVVPPRNVGQLFENALGAIRVILYDDAREALDEQDRAHHFLGVSVLFDKECWQVVATYRFSDPHTATMFKLAQG